MPRDVGVFLQWCAERGIEIDPRLEVVEGPEGDWRMSCNGRVEMGESLVRIPKWSVFSPKTCSRDIVASGDLGLSLALLIDISLGQASPWYGYMQALPVVDIALFWGLDGNADGVEARKWLRGTQVERELDGLLERVKLFYENTARPVLEEMSIQSSGQDFYRAYAIVSSRAFLVDAYLGLSLVPVADMSVDIRKPFNHSEGHQVHLESDYHVCASCGSLGECEHDLEEGDHKSSTPMVDTCEMVANMDICRGEEVFNLYEKGLTNAQLLCRYGFAVEGNEYNVVSWSAEEVLKGRDGKGWRELLGRWPIAEEWDESQLVYSGVNVDLNADGQVSHGLWLLLLTVTWGDIDMDAARQICLAQVRREAGRRPMDDDPGPLRDIADAIVRMCDLKMRSVHLPAVPDAEVGERLDELPGNYKLTRLAVSNALEERRVVAACRGGWLEFTDFGLNR